MDIKTYYYEHKPPGSRSGVNLPIRYPKSAKLPDIWIRPQKGHPKFNVFYRPIMDNSPQPVIRRSFYNQVDITAVLQAFPKTFR